LIAFLAAHHNAPLEYSIPQNHDIVTLPNGDIAWLIADDGAKELKLVIAGKRK
jgi:hypothetical protein